MTRLKKDFVAYNLRYERYERYEKKHILQKKEGESEAEGALPRRQSTKFHAS